MPPSAALSFLTLLIFSTSVQCQFEFNDQQTVYHLVVDLVPMGEVSCIAILRPPDQNPAQKFVIDSLTHRLAKEDFNARGGDRRRPTVMSYTTEMYKEFYMNHKKRQVDTCSYWITVVMVSNSTNQQLASLSESYYFDGPFWVLFYNRSELGTIFRNVHLRISTRFFVVFGLGYGIFRVTEIGPSGANGRFSFWTKQGGMTVASAARYQKLAKSTLKVGTIEFPPYVEIIRNNSGQISSVTGFYGDLWNDLQETLQFKSVYVEPIDGVYGSVNANRNWTGLYSMMTKKQADVILSDLTISPSLHDIVDFLYPIERTKYKIFYKKDAEVFDWLKVFRPLDYPVWIALLVWIFLGGLATFFLTKVEKNFQNQGKNYSLITCIYFVLRTLCCQGCEQIPRLWALRLFFLTAYLMAGIILPSYSASLISVLTTKTNVEPFKSLSEILSTDFKLTVEWDSTDYDFFQKATDPIHQKIYEKSVVKNEQKQAGNYHGAMQRTCKDSKTVFFGIVNDVTAIYRQKKIQCVLLPLKSEISPAYKTIAVAKNSQYREILKKQLLRMSENGLISRYKRLYLTNDYEESENDVGIRLVDVGAIFIYFGVLIALSAGIFCVEFFSWRRPTVRFNEY